MYCVMPTDNRSNRTTKAAEALRQQNETFEQRKKHDRQWFKLRLAMGYSAMVILIGVAIILGFILVNFNKYPDKIVSWAGPALFVDILGLVLTIWKIVLNPNFSTKLEPVTKVD